MLHVASLPAVTGMAILVAMYLNEDRGRTSAELRALRERLAAAQQSGKLAEVEAVASAANAALGDQAGVPEVDDQYATIPADEAELSAAEVRRGFAPYLRLLGRQKWWRIGLDPTATEHALREPASLIVGAVAVHRAGLDGSREALAEAREAGDFLIWAQQQAGVGVFPFPAFRGGKGGAFEAAERALKQADRSGLTAAIVRNGWVVEDGIDGGLQFDNGECGVALFDLYEATRDDRYLKSACAAADWAIGRMVVTNWNYNSFSVFLLARAYAVTGEARYREAAVLKARLGVLPGQLKSGPYQGRWGDPHNARPAYHYIMVRALAWLTSVLGHDDPARPAVVECLRLALASRNQEIVARGAMNKDKVVEALAIIHERLPDAAHNWPECQTEPAWHAMGRLVAAQVRANRAALAPGPWGLYLEQLARRPTQPGDQ